jgi:hypothetical protein
MSVTDYQCYCNRSMRELSGALLIEADSVICLLDTMATLMLLCK